MQMAILLFDLPELLSASNRFPQYPGNQYIQVTSAGDA